MSDDNKLQQEVRNLKLRQHHLLETLKDGIMVLDSRDTIVSHNEAAVNVWGLPGLRLDGKKLHNSELVVHCPELRGRVEATRSGAPENVSFPWRLKIEGEEHVLSINLRPVLNRKGERDGTIIHMEDITTQDKLQNTVEQLEAAGGELQYVIEELETTNEELQSTNKELETTNEALQSTNEELQSLNEELERINEELERRSRELNELTRRYAETLHRMPWPVLLVDRDEKIQLWNTAARRLFGVGATTVVGVGVDQLPIESGLRKNLIRHCRMVLDKNKPSVMRNEKFSTATYSGAFDLHFTSISKEAGQFDGVLVMFGPQYSEPKIGKPRNSRKK